MVPRESLQAKYNKSSIGPARLKHSAKSPPVFYMISLDKSSRGVLRPRMPRQWEVPLNANGSCFTHIASPNVQCSNVHRFKLFLEPHALRDEHAVDPRLPSLPVSVHFHPAVCITHTSEIRIARKARYRRHCRLSEMSVGICARADHTRNRRCCRFGCATHITFFFHSPVPLT